MQTITTIGLDIAKSVFQVHGVDATGQMVIRRQLKRRCVVAVFQMLPPCLVGIEACASSRHWSRELQALGHKVRLIPPAYVKPYGAPRRRVLPRVAAADEWDSCVKLSDDLAVAGCSRAIDAHQYTDRSLARLYARRGGAYQALGDLNHAMLDFNESMRIDPTYPPAYNNRGNTW